MVDINFINFCLLSNLTTERVEYGDRGSERVTAEKMTQSQSEKS